MSVFPRVFLCVFMLCCFHVGQCWCKVGAFLVQSRRILGAKLVHSWCKVGAKLAHSWCKVGAFLVPCWCILGARFSHLLPYNFKKKGIKLCTQNCTNFAPRIRQLCTNNAPTLDQECTNFAPTLSKMKAPKHETLRKNT